MVAYQASSAPILDSSLVGDASRYMTIRVLETGPKLRVLAIAENGRPRGDFWYYAARFELEVCLARPVVCSVNGRPRAWSVTHHQPEPLEELGWWTMFELWEYEVTETEASTWLEHGSGDARRDRAWRQISDICRFIGERALRAADPRARSVVREMDDRTAFHAYAALLDDPTGRVAQMIEVCPNLFTLATTPCHSRQNALHSLARGIRDGVKLHKLVDEALAFGLTDYGPRGCASTLSVQANALVRHLPVLALDELLAILHAPGVDLNDLLGAGKARETWASFMADWGRRARSLDGEQSARRIGGFFSRRAVELHDSFHTPEEILDWIVRSGAPAPDRSSSLRRIRDQVHAWHRDLWELELVDATPLSPGPRATSRIVGIDASQVITVGELVAEGARMCHCVASLASEAVAGACFIYSATVLGTPITIDVRRADTRWRLYEASGFDNRKPTVDQLFVIDQWIEALR